MTPSAIAGADVIDKDDTVGLLSASASCTSGTADGGGKQQQSQGPTTAEGVPFDTKSLLDSNGTKVDAKRLPHKTRMALALQGPTLIFDGICNLCNGSMSWFQERVRKEDRPVWYMWAQHADTQSLLSELGISRHDILRSWAYLEDGIVYRGSAAWLRALRNLRSPWCYLSHFDWTPEFIRETVYNTVAANRYNALGHSDACQRPNPEMRARFLHSTAVKGPKPDSTIPPRVRRRLLIVGCGPAGLFIAKKMAPSKDFEVVVVEPKNFFEFTPGILRGMCHPEAMKDLVFDLEPVLCDDLGVGYVQGAVTSLSGTKAVIRRLGGDGDGERSSNGILRLSKAAAENKDVETNMIVPPSASSDPALEDCETVEINFDFCVVAAGSAYTTSTLWKVPVATEEKLEDSTNLFSKDRRIVQLSSEHSKLESLNQHRSARVSIFGAGLVGIELASEIRHYFPDIERISLFDPQPTVLPALPQSAQKYATEWMERNNVELILGSDFNDESVKDAEDTSDVVYKCVGVRVNTPFMPKDVLDARGQILVNNAMQILLNEKALDKDAVDLMGADRAAIFGSGRIFAIGDCVSVKGADPPYIKDTYPAEAMAEVVVANLYKSKTIQCMASCPGVLRELGSLQVMTLCSLGPSDGLFCINDRMVSWGRPAMIVKGTIEVTKMSDSRNEVLGRSFWSMVPHW
jgi:NADH dehydrogenase FAD-containing subunit/predicted DCC family thiol-disulfide oxidoreductase YuxK